MRGELDVEGKFVWLAIGRFERAKDYPQMIRAFAGLVKRTNEEMVLLICGRGSLEQEIRAEVSARGLDRQIRFLGVRTDIPAVMNAADGFVLSSYLEGLPMVLLQAASIGLPIVATNVGGNAEVVTDNVNGFVVPPGDPVALAGGMERILNLSSVDRAAMAQQGQSLAREKFEIERILDRWEALYVEKMNQNRRAKSAVKE